MKFWRVGLKKALTLCAMAMCLTGCAGALGKIQASALGLLPLSGKHLAWIQPGAEVLINGEHYELSGFDPCPAVAGMQSFSNRCIRLSPDRWVVRVEMRTPLGDRVEAHFDVQHDENGYRLSKDDMSVTLL